MTRAAVIALALLGCGRRAPEAETTAVPPPTGSGSGSAKASTHPLVPAELVDCTPGGWCRFAAMPAGEPIELVYSDAPDRFWAAAVRGMIARWDGTKLVHYRVPIDRQIFAIWGDAKDAWVVGTRGDQAEDVALRFRDGAWIEVPVPKKAGFADVDGKDGHVWLMGDSTLVHVFPDGKTEEIEAPVLARAIWVAGPTDVWLAGSKRVVRYRDGAWTDLPAPPAQANNLDHYSLDGADPQNVWLVWERATLQWDGTAWRDRTLKDQASGSTVRVVGPREVVLTEPGGHARRGSYARFTDRWSDPERTNGIPAALGPGKIVVAGIGYELRDGASSKRVLVGSGIDARTIWSNPNGVWIGGRALDGDRAAIAHWDGTTWKRETLDGKEIVDIDGYERPWLLGADGKVWRRTASGWTAEQSKAYQPSTIVVGADDDVWVAGADVYRRVGGTWEAAAFHERVPYVTALAIAPDGSVFAAEREDDQHANLVRWNGGKFERVALVPPTQQIIAFAADRVVLRRYGVVRTWTGGDPLDEARLGGQIHDVARIGDTIYATGFKPPRIDLAGWAAVDVDAAELAGDGGVVWAMARPSGELWVKRIDGARRTPPKPTPRAAVAVAVADAGSAALPPTIDVPDPSGGVARLELALPAGWTRVPGAAITYRAASGATLEIAIGFEIPDRSKAEAALKEATDAVSRRQPDAFHLSAFRTDHGYVEDWKTRRGRDIYCYAMNTGRYAVRIHAALTDAAAADALVAACKSARLR